MKYLKLYEVIGDIDPFHDEDWDEEEFEDFDNIKVGDFVILKTDNWVRSDVYATNPDLSSYSNYNTKLLYNPSISYYFKFGFEVIKISTKKDGTCVMKLYHKFPWYECKYWKKNNNK